MIWCVEDDSSIRDIEVYALQSTGFEAKGFEDGDSFWNAIKYNVPGGTGLGLSIVKHAAACHKATLELESTPGKGTTITVTF